MDVCIVLNKSYAHSPSLTSAIMVLDKMMQSVFYSWKGMLRGHQIQPDLERWIVWQV